jgi:hypothetical protein
MKGYFNLSFKVEKTLNDIRFCNFKERKDYQDLKSNIEKGELNKKNIVDLVSHLLANRERFEKAFTSSI